VSDQLLDKLSRRMLSLKKPHIFYEKKYLEIFRLFCIVGESINTSNQTKILVQFMKKLNSDDTYRISITKKDD